MKENDPPFQFLVTHLVALIAFPLLAPFVLVADRT